MKLVHIKPIFASDDDSLKQSYEKNQHWFEHNPHFQQANTYSHGKKNLGIVARSETERQQILFILEYIFRGRMFDECIMQLRQLW